MTEGVSESDQERRVRLVSFYLAIVAALAGSLIFAWVIYVVSTEFAYWQEILNQHFAAIIGLPGAAAVAFAIVVFLRQTDGPIEFEGLGFKFKGAAGQVVMWALCFGVIATAIKLCW